MQCCNKKFNLWLQLLNSDIFNSSHNRGLKIIREGSDYYLVHQGEVQRYLGSRKNPRQVTGHNCPNFSSERDLTGESSFPEEKSCRGILDKILFFIGDLEVASADAKRSRVLWWYLSLNPIVKFNVKLLCMFVCKHCFMYILVHTYQFNKYVLSKKVLH